MSVVFVTGGSGFVGRRLLEALRDRGHRVRALARSEHSAKVVASLGAEPIMGDLNDGESIRAGMEGVELVFHSGACVGDWGSAEMFHSANVEGTRCVFHAAREQGVSTFVHVSTEAVLADSEPIIQADETRARPTKPIGLYSKTKALAEEIVLGEDSGDMTTVVVRPRLVWGAGDTSLLPQFLKIIASGQYHWIAGGRYLTSTCHVRNVCEGLLLAAERGRDKSIYFLTDGPAVEFREFITSLVATHGVDPGSRSLPRFVAKLGGSLCDLLWGMAPLPGRPPLTRAGVRIVGEEVTVNDAKARRELGYRSRVTREEGLEEMRRLCEQVRPAEASSSGAQSITSDTLQEKNPR